MYNYSNTIYSDEDHEWYFLIPTDAELPAGVYTLRTLLGREIQVDPASVDAYVVPREFAEAYLSGQVSAALDNIGEGVRAFFERATAPPPTDDDPSPAPPTRAERTVRLLSDLMDEPAESLQTDSDAAKRGWLTLAEKVDRFLTNIKNGDEDAAKAQIEAFAATLQRHGIDVKTKRG